MKPFIETSCTVEHEGHSYTSGGAAISDHYIIAYPYKDGSLRDWHGGTLGRWYEVSRRPAIFFGYWSHMSTTYHYMRARLIDGRCYSLRGFGVGMVATGKRIKDSTF